MRQIRHTLTVRAPSQGLHEVTAEIAQWIDAQDMHDGLLTVFIRHTSASILIQENIDDDVVEDLEAFFDRLAPEGLELYRHTAEGTDDMPAHIKAALMQTQLAIPVSQDRMMLGRYQGLFVFEHRRTPRPREIVLHLLGE
ncbi:MAG: secondary thiamine-phosphate synthase enzyme YjbQ [Rhodospirillales bacterium]|jgi:secondary thiamine-phosphate synthase enzyme|nr:secondary thiamine-phosphate synthase enzyme YjbQ [Rhodospirillales bacterium]